MAQKLQGFIPAKSGPKYKYPYSEWFDGQVWQLRKGRDFQCETSTMHTSLRKIGRSLGYKIRVSQPSDTILVVQMVGSIEI